MKNWKMVSARKNDQKPTRQDHCEIYPRTNDSGMMVQSGEKTALAEPESFLQLFSHRIGTLYSVRVSKSLFRNDMWKLGDWGFRSL